MNKNNRIAMLLAAAMVLPAAAHAADDVHRFAFADVLASPEAKDKLDPSIRFYLAGERTPKVLEKKGEFASNKKTNAFGKGAEPTCKHAALSALLSLQERARQVGANAVVGMVSYYKKHDVASATEYECHVGALMTGVAFKGTMARVAER